MNLVIRGIDGKIEQGDRSLVLGAAAAADHDRLRVHVMVPAAELSAYRRTRRRQDHHSGPLTATLHNGKAEDFQNSMVLHDANRSARQFCDVVQVVEITDLMRRCVKETLVNESEGFTSQRLCGYALRHVLHCMPIEWYVPRTVLF